MCVINIIFNVSYISRSINSFSVRLGVNVKVATGQTFDRKFHRIGLKYAISSFSTLIHNSKVSVTSMLSVCENGIVRRVL